MEIDRDRHVLWGPCLHIVSMACASSELMEAANQEAGIPSDSLLFGINAIPDAACTAASAWRVEVTPFCEVAKPTGASFVVGKLPPLGESGFSMANTVCPAKETTSKSGGDFMCW